MAKITVKVYTTIRNKLLNERIALDVVDVGEALDALERHFGYGFKKEVREPDGSIKESYIVALNGHPVDRKSPEKIKLSNNDILHLYPAVAGG